MELGSVNLLSDKEINSLYTEDAFKAYIKELESYPLLSLEESISLLKAYKNGDVKAKEKLVVSNLRLVISIARKYSYNLNHLEFLDLIQEGNIGLMKAIDHWDPEKGAFSTCAYDWITQCLLISLYTKDNSIHIPYNFKNLVKKYNEIENKEFKTIEEICQILRITPKTYYAILNYQKFQTISLNEKINDEDDSEFLDYIGILEEDYFTLEDKENNIQTLSLLKKYLTDQEYYIIYYRVIEKKAFSLQQLANEINISKQSINQKYERGLNRVKNILTNNRVHSSYLKMIKNKNYNLNPITPSILETFIFLKDSLTDLEKNLYISLYFDLEAFKDTTFIENNNITKQELVSLLKTLNEKIKIAKNSSQFQVFKHSLTKQYRSKIYNYNYNFKVYDYAYLNDTYLNLPYEELIHLFRDNKININEIIFYKYYMYNELDHIDEIFKYLKTLDTTILLKDNMIKARKKSE